MVIFHPRITLPQHMIWLQSSCPAKASLNLGVAMRVVLASEMGAEAKLCTCCMHVQLMCVCVFSSSLCSTFGNHMLKLVAS